MNRRLRVMAALAALAFAGVLMAQQPTPTVEAAWKLVARGERDAAVAMLRALIPRAPRNADARLLLGSLLMEAGARDESIQQLNAAVELRPRSAEAHNALGEAYNTFGRQKPARREFERAVDLDPKLVPALVSLAAIELEHSENATAAKHLDAALRISGTTPDSAYPFYLRAKIYTDEGTLEKARAALEQAVTLRPDFGEAWSDLGEARKNLNDDAGALAALQRAVEVSPDDAIARTRLGSRLLGAGRAHDAIPHLEQAERLDPKNQSALNALLLALRQDGRIDESRAVKAKLAQVIRERDANDQRLVAALEFNNKGVALAKSGNLTGAVENYRAALERNPDHSGIRLNLAVTLLKLGRWDEGLAEMRDALRRDPDNPLIREALDDALAQYKAHQSSPRRP